MFLHLFMFRWAEGATQADKDRALTEIRTTLATIPTIRRVEAGHNVSARGNGFGTGCMMTFDDEAGFLEYQSHPLHLDFVRWVLPLVEAADMDFECPSSA